jgi:hypothetical protein
MLTTSAILLLAYLWDPLHALHWGSWKDNGCSKEVYGTREKSAVLWGIGWGQSWERACESMPADIDGYHFDRPHRCEKNVNMWGVCQKTHSDFMNLSCRFSMFLTVTVFRTGVTSRMKDVTVVIVVTLPFFGTFRGGSAGNEQLN